MITILSLFFILLYFILDKTKKKIFAIPTSIFVFLYALSFDLYNWDEISIIVFQFKNINLGFKSYLLFCLTLLSFAIAIAITNYKDQQNHSITRYNYKRLKQVYYTMSFISIFAFCINLSRILSNGGLGLLLLNPRTYEEIFGASTFINYLYFLNVPALCLSIYLKHNNIKIKKITIINTILIAISFFHGIKFTIFDTILYPVCFYYLLRDKVSLKPLIVTFSILIGIFVLFSTFIRGGDSKSPLLSVLLYILPNFYNLSYNIENHTNTFGFSGLMGILIPDKVPKPPLGWLQIGEREGGFILNDAYNMFTVLDPLFYALNYAGPLFFILIFILLRYAYNRKQKSLIHLFLSTYLLFCLFFTFYFYAFAKTKNIYYVLVFIAIHTFCKIKKVKHTI